ncbi:hypothetical protein [Exiguobacterium sp. s5]|uniref:hypothetical protein n=1 Tax=Exiguobacterium sp. s5 TaxID=2751239 RepID=UPI001BE97FA1|nr:hypothetical protein [Exiguobacterium sp. s5]
MWTIIDQRIVPVSLWGDYRATRQLYASFGKNDVFLGGADQPLVVLTPLDAHTYRLTAVDFDPAHFDDLWHLDRGNQKGSLRRFLEANGVLR